MIRLVFDIGGTNTRMAVAENGVLSHVEKVPTTQDPTGVLRQLHAFAEGKGMQDAVGGVAGINVDGLITDSPNLRSWEGFSFGHLLEETLQVPVRIYNDAELAALGESLNGAGKGYARVGYLVIGTGVGGALIVNEGSGPLIEGTEPGRVVMGPGEGRTLESFVGGASLEAEAGMRPKLLAQSVYDERTSVLAEGIRTLLDLWTPDVFILNGPLVLGTPAFRIENITEELSRIVAKPVPPVVLASFRDESGLWGGVFV